MTKMINKIDGLILKHGFALFMLSIMILLPQLGLANDAIIKDLATNTLLPFLNVGKWVVAIVGMFFCILVSAMSVLKGENGRAGIMLGCFVFIVFVGMALMEIFANKAGFTA